MTEPAVAALQPGDIVSCNEMCLAMRSSLQQGMNVPLPSSSVSEIGERQDASEAVYYQKQDETSFLVCMASALGESETCDSKSGRRDEHP